MNETNLAQQLAVAAFTLASANGNVVAQANVSDYSREWEVDTSYLSYSESDQRVDVSKFLANLTRRDDTSTLAVSVVSDTMSGASPTGAIRSDAPAVSFTGASGAASNDYFKSAFDDSRKQLGFTYKQSVANDIGLGIGAIVSQESDYDSFGVDVGVSRASDDSLKTHELKIAYTSDTIYRSDTGGTPEPLSNVQSPLSNAEGEKATMEVLMGYTRVLNKHSVAQFNLTLGHSEGYHSDPYKIISAAGEDNRIVANFRDSRPDSRLRVSVYGKVVHQIRNTTNTIGSSYRYYKDDWGIGSHTVDFRYRRSLSPRQFLEPHLRLYHQTHADFYHRKLNVDSGSNPLLPSEGVASADYRLDTMTTATIGLSYGLTLVPGTRLRFHAAYLDQRFSNADFKKMNALITQVSLSYRF